MSVRVSGKHMEIGESFRQRIEDNIGLAVTKYFDGGYSGQVTVEKSGSRFAADCRASQCVRVFDRARMGIGMARSYRCDCRSAQPQAG